MGDLVTDIQMAANGRLVLPQAVRKAMGIEGETRLIVSVENGEVRLTPVIKRVAQAQELYRRYVKQDFTSDEFLATRERD